MKSSDILGYVFLGSLLGLTPGIVITNMAAPADVIAGSRPTALIEVESMDDEIIMLNVEHIVWAKQMRVIKDGFPKMLTQVFLSNGVGDIKIKMEYTEFWRRIGQAAGK